MDDCWIKILIFVVTWVLADALGLLFWALNRWMLMAVAAFAHLYLSLIHISEPTRPY